MSEVQRKSKFLQTKNICLIIAFFMAIVPLLHKLPAIGPIPRIGPFDAEPLRALVFALSVLICVISSSLAVKWWRNNLLRYVGFFIDVTVVLCACYASWRFYVDVTAMHENIVFFEPYQAWTALGGCLVIIYMTWRMWGAPLALVGAVALTYFLFSFQETLVDDLTENMWLALDDGVLGNIADIVLSTVFAFIILGAMLEGTGAGLSLIKVSFRSMRHFRGGPAHAAVLASGLFGTVSGSAVANVVGTGVITIPMIKRRGFTSNFAGGVEATASTGGQIMPPIMGAAALVMADFIGVSYLTVIVAAIVPAIFYYVSLFVSIVFESRRLGIEANEEEIDPTLEVSRQDYFNLLLIAAPIGSVIVALLQGVSPAGSALIALFLLILLSPINPDIRRRPFLLVRGFAEGGFTFAKLFMAVGTIGIVVGALSSTGLPIQLALLLDQFLGETLVLTLLIASIACIILGMGMPTLPAYLTIIVIMGSAIAKFGLEPLPAHMFVFYFGVASAITPPVAIAAYAAASISGGRPIATGVSAVRIGIVIFALPFFWAFNPMMLIVPESGVKFDFLSFLVMMVRLSLMTYLLASFTSRFDARRIGLMECVARAAIGLALIVPNPFIHLVAICLGTALISYHRIAAKKERSL